jgi:hypothetical protein
VEFGFKSFEELFTSRTPLGVARLSVKSFFKPERVLTLIFEKDRVDLEVCGPERSPHDYANDDEFGPNDFDSERGSIPLDQAPEWAQSWDAFRSFSTPLDSFRRHAWDGIS